MDDLDILIDAGDKSHGDEVVNYLKSQGVDDLELAIGTHAHADHIGGMPEVFEAYEVERYIDSGTVATTQIYKKVMADVAAEECLYNASPTEAIIYGNLTIQIISPGNGHKDTNDDSVIAYVTYGDTSMLFLEMPVLPWTGYSPASGTSTSMRPSTTAAGRGTAQHCCLL